MSPLRMLHHLLSRRSLGEPRPDRPDFPESAGPRPGGRRLGGAPALALLGLALGLGLVWAPLACAQTQTLTTIAELVRASAERLPGLLAAGAFRLWAALATLEIVAFAIDRSNGREGWLKPAIVRALWLSFTLALVLAAPGNLLTPAVVLAGAEHVATLLTGVAGFDPSAILDQGIQIFTNHLLTAWSSGYFGFDFRIQDFGGVLVTALVHLAAYLLIAVAVFLLFVQGAVALAFAPLAGAFGAARWTVGITESYAAYLLWWSFKLIAFAVIFAVGNDVALLTDTAISVAGQTQLVRQGVTWQVALLSLGYAVAILLVPGQLAQKLTQSTPISLRQLLS